MLKNYVHDNTAESCIEILSGVHPQHDYDGRDVDENDKHLILSLTKQTFKGIAYTDRQYELVKNKIDLYKDVLSNLDINVDECKSTLRRDLRHIDRSKWIAIHEVNGVKYIAVRFTFNKKLISALESLRTSGINKVKIRDDKDNKIAYYPLSEINIYKIIETLKDRNFKIDDNINSQFEKIEMMMKNKKNYLPGIYGFKLKNLNDKAVDYMITDIGQEPSPENLALYKDRDALYGIEHFDEEDLESSCKNLTTLSQRIVRRSETQVLINSQSFTINNIAESILELNRYPLLVCLDSETDTDDLTSVYHSFRNIFANEDFCVLYRKDNDTAENKHFNQYIKENNLNNSLGNNSKIVYTTQDKLVKTLLKENWRPKSALVFGCTRQVKIKTYLDELDLVMYYDTDTSPFLRNIEKI